MKLLTKELEDKLPKLYATENISVSDKTVLAKWSIGKLTYYVIEGERREHDFTFWGYVENEVKPTESDFKYFAIGQLEERMRLNNSQIDSNFTPTNITELVELF